MKTHANTREQIIQAAYKVLAEQGYDAATIKAIAHEAGVAPGLVHYYFTNKDELLIEVLNDISARFTESMRQISKSLPADQVREAALDNVLQRALQTPEIYRLRYEVFALGLRNPALLPAIASFLANARSGISHVIRAAVGERALDVNALAGILFACFNGLALQHLAEPDFDIEGAYRLLSRILQTFLDTD
jgi:AcrR family transcriptional regulator